MDLKDKQIFKKNITSPLLKNIKSYFLSDKTEEEKFYRFELEIDDTSGDLDPISWLLEQDEQVKTYWSSRNKNFCVAGIGYADIITEKLREYSADRYFIRDIFAVIKSRVSNSNIPVKYFGCLAFNENDRMDSSWESFGKAYFLVPKVEIFTLDRKKFIACNIFYKPSENKSKKDIFEEIQQFIENIEPLGDQTEVKKVRYESRSDNPGKEKWLKNIVLAIATFDFEQISKMFFQGKQYSNLEKR